MRLIRPSRSAPAGSEAAGKAVIEPRQILLRHRAHHIGRDQNHQFGLVVDEVAAVEQRAENRQLRQPGQAVDSPLGLLRNQARPWPASSPDGISSVVFARRVLIEDGQEFVELPPSDCVSVIALSVDTSDTSVITRKADPSFRLAPPA